MYLKETPKMAKEKGFIRRFFGGIGKILAFIRGLFTAIITLILIAYVVVAVGMFAKPGQIPEEGALRVEIAGRIVDQYTYIDPLSQLAGSDQPNEYLLRDFIAAIDAAKDDSRINSMVLVLHNMENSGISKIEELGEAIEQFKATGKRVVAVADAYSQQQYLLATYADEILLNPMGAVELLGLSSYRLYMADAIEKLGINVHVFRTGPHKSAVEPLIASEMSDEAREQSQWLLNDLWGTVQESILSRRELSEAELIEYSTSLDRLMLQSNGDLAQLALDFKLVDQIVTRDEIMSILQSYAGINDDEDFYEHVNVQPYLRSQNFGDEQTPENRVGLIVAKGTIYDGIQESGSIGGDSTAYLLKQARLYDDLDALVIRVDSPGGSAFASEVIRREVELIKQENIPVFISMGSVAASGGYWISSPADEIWATPTTITGSIGAFAALATFEDSLDKLGLNSDGVSTGPLAGALSVDRPLSEQAKTILQSRIDNLYGQFLYQVSNDREIPLEDLEPIAGGRVWTGNQALEIGLVDQIGSLGDVIDAAATKAGLGADYELKLIELPRDPAQQVLKWLTDQMSMGIDSGHWLSRIFAFFAPLAENVDEVGAKLELLTDPENMYLHCEICDLR
eukprot:g4322.t1